MITEVCELFREFDGILTVQAEIRVAKEEVDKAIDRAQKTGLRLVAKSTLECAEAGKEVEIVLSFSKRFGPGEMETEEPDQDLTLVWMHGYHTRDAVVDALKARVAELEQLCQRE